MKKKEIKWLVPILALSILTRGLTLFAPSLAGDETSVGLMGLRIMGGEFPIFYYGQSFMGSLEGFLMGSYFFIFGSFPLILEGVPVFFSVLFLLLLYLLARAFFNYKAALISIALLSIPPFFLLGWSHEARLHYHLVIVFGNVLLLLFHFLVQGEVSSQKRNLLFAVLGLISGIAWWTNYLIITYILPVGLLIVFRNRRIFWRKECVILGLMFLWGSLPLWAFQTVHRFSTGGIAGLADSQAILSNLKNFGVNAFPILLGMLPPIGRDLWEFWSYVIIGIICFAAVVYYGYKCRDSFKPSYYRSIAKTSGREIFFLLLLIALMINLLTNYGVRLSDDDQKYLLPLYTCLPVFLSVFILGLSKKFGLLSFLPLGIILSSNLIGDLRHNGWLVFNPQKYQTYQKNEDIENQLIRFLIHNGYTRLYLNNGSLSKRLIFKTREGLICSHPYQEGFLKYAFMVEAASRPVYLSKGEDQGFEANMKVIGGNYKKTASPGGYWVYNDFKPPPENYRMIPRDLWSGMSDFNPLEVRKAFDGDMATGWRIRDKGNKAFTLSLGSVERVGKIVFIPDSFREVPPGFSVELSLDGLLWQKVAEIKDYKGPIFWSGPNPMIKVRQGRVEAVFPSRRCRFLRIVSEQADLKALWSINELFLFGTEDEKERKRNPDVADLVRLVNFLKEQKTQFVYANPWLSAVIRVKSNWEIDTPISNYFTGDNGENEPPADGLSKVRLGPRVALVIEEETDEMEKILSAAHYTYRKNRVGAFSLYFDFLKQRWPKPLIGHHWQASSNVNSGEAAWAIDQNPATRWTSGKPQESGMYFQIDLKTTQRVRGCSLFLGKFINDFPRALKLLASTDGTTWQEIKVISSSDLYWTGETLLRITGERTYYFFPPMDLRYLRLHQEGQAFDNYWSIHELELF